MNNKCIAHEVLQCRNPVKHTAYSPERKANIYACDKHAKSLMWSLLQQQPASDDKPAALLVKF